MLSHAGEEIKQQLFRLNLKQASLTTPVSVQREQWDKDCEQDEIPDSVSVEAINASHITGHLFTNRNGGNKTVLLYLHGGGYCLGSFNTHKRFVANLVQRTSCAAFFLDYPLAPEYPFPTALDKGVESYHWLRNQGYAASEIVVVGDSSGGGLALSLLLKLKGLGLPLPGAAVMFSPWLDMRLTSDYLEQNAALDPLVSSMDLAACRDRYCGGWSIDHPLLSPVCAELSGLPPLLIQVAQDEVLLGDSLLFKQNENQYGVRVELTVWPRLWHFWQSNIGVAPEADEAVSQVVHFIQSTLN